MVRGVDDLIYFLLERISVHSGATYSDLKRYVQEFYGKSDDIESEQASLLVKTTDPPGEATVDDHLLNKTWQWLTEEPDIRVERVDEEPTGDGTAQHSVRPSYSESQQDHSSNGGALIHGRASPRVLTEDAYRGLVLRTTPERVWKAVAGHDVDLSRVLKSEFDLLCHIAASGENGIVQTDLLHQSKQDKRSLPKRTDELHRKGYIVKTAIRCSGGTTSHCVLRKFASIRNGQTKDADWLQMTPEQIKEHLFPESGFQKAKFIVPAMAIIKEAGTISMNELRERMGIVGDRSARRTVDLWLYHLEMVGCIERLLAKGSRHVQIQSIKYIKDADRTAQDAYTKFNRKDRQSLWMERNNDPEHINRLGSPVFGLRNNDHSTTTELSETIDSLMESAADLPADSIPETTAFSSSLKWHPQRPLENQIHDIIKASGPSGITTPDLVASLGGATSYRSLDSVLARLTDTWQESQPQHLRHLTIIRDTTLRSGSLVFHYRTLPNFDLAVQRGEASWEAVRASNEGAESNHISSELNSRELDVWGFPQIPKLELGPSLSSKAKSKVKKPSTKGVFAPDLQPHALLAQPIPRTKTKPAKRYPRVGVKPAQPRPIILYLTKLHEDFMALMWEMAKEITRRQTPREEFVSRSVLGVIGQDSSSHIAISAEPGLVQDNSPERHNASSIVTEGDHGLDEHAGTDGLTTTLSYDGLEKTYKDLLRMSLPGLYVNPPQRYPKSIGRPKKRLLLIIKSDHLRDLNWFINSPASERYHHDPRKMIDPVDVVEESWNRAAKWDMDANMAHTETPGEPLSHSNSDPSGSQRNTTPPLDMTVLQTEEDQSPDIAEQPATPPARRREALKPQIPSKPHIPKSSRPIPTRKQKGVRLNGGSQDRLRIEMIIRFITEAGGAYPGPRELWYPFITAQKKIDMAAKPDPGTVERAVTGLVKSGKLKRIVFAFKGPGGATVNRSLVSLPHLDGNSEIVQNLESKMIEHYPYTYLPETVEVDLSLKISEQDRLGLNLEMSQSRDEREFRQTVDNHQSKKRRRSKKDEDSDSGNDSDDDEATEEQLQLQSEFVVERYLHEPEAVPRPNTVGQKLGKILKLDIPENIDATKVKPRRSKPSAFRNTARPRNKPPLPVDPLLLGDEESSLASSSRIYPKLAPIQWEFKAVPETAAAAEQEALREQHALQAAIDGRSTFDNESFINFNFHSWILSSTKHRPRLAFVTTFTDPDQRFNPESGTFSTEFATFRDLRPKLTLETGVLRSFENLIPKSLADIIEPSAGGRKDSRKSRSAANFYSVVDAVQAWEEENVKILSSAASFVTPYFVNHTISDGQITDNSNSELTTEKSVVRKRMANSSPNGETAAKRRRVAAGTGIGLQAQAGQPEHSNITRSYVLAGYTQWGSLGQPARHSSHVVQRGSPIIRFSEPVEDPLQRPLSTSTSKFSRTSGAMNTRWRRPGRKSVKESQLSEPQITKLITIVVVVRCLLGGTERVIKWSIVAELFTDFNLSGIKYRWNKFSLIYRREIEALERDFQEKFVSAYETNEVEAPQYDSIDSYDWSKLIDWALAHMCSIQTNEAVDPDETLSENEDEALQIELFEDRARFERSFIVQETPGTVNATMNDVLNPVLSINRRKQLLANMSFSTPLANPLAQSGPKDAEQEDIVKSYVRATILTPGFVFDPQAARTRLLHFGESALESAIEELRDAKIIRQEKKGRVVPGRNYSMSKSFNDGLKSRWKTGLLSTAFKYTRVLSEKFSARGSAEFSPHSSQGEVLALLNLESMGQVKIQLIVPSTSSDPSTRREDAIAESHSLSIWGFTEGDYKTTAVHVKNFVFPVLIAPTALWNSHSLGYKSTSDPPAPHLRQTLKSGTKKAMTKIPVWYDIHDRIMPHILELVVTIVAYALALLPGSSAKEVGSICKNAIDEWEIGLLLEWMETIKAVKRTRVRSNRFEPTPWWWFILGREISARS